MEFSGKRSGAADAEPESRKLLDSRMIDQTVVERGDAEEEGGVVGFEGVKDDVGIESSQDHRRSTCVQGSVKPHAQSVHVEEGQAQDKPVVR